MSATYIFVGVAALQSDWDSGFDNILAQVLVDITAFSLRCRIQKYVITADYTMEKACQQFLRDSVSYTRRAFVAGTATSELLQADTYLNNGTRSIPVFSVGATATQEVIATRNAMTWMPLNRTAAMMMFIQHVLYDRQTFYIVYDDNDARYAVFIRSFVEDLTAQAAQLQLPICVNTLDAIDILPDDSTVVLLASNAAILAAGPERLNTSAANSSMILMTDINAGAHAAWFGDNVVPLCLLPYSLNYTTTTLKVLEALGPKKFTANAYVYALYDCLFDLAKFSLTGYALTLDNFVKYPVNVFPTGSAPLPAYIQQEFLSTVLRSPRFGKYALAFVKPVLVEEPLAFVERFLGGNPLMPDSLAVLYQVGIVSWFNTRLFWDENRLTRLRSAENDEILLEKFDANNVRILPTDQFVPPNNAQDSLRMGIQFVYDEVETTIPIRVADIQLYARPRPVNPTMGKEATVYHV
jgi:hypothetical protein